MAHLSDLDSIRREFYRLVNSDSTDASMTEQDATTLEGVDQLLNDAVDEAQMFLMDAGLGELWLTQTGELSFVGQDPNKYAILPGDFIRLGGDEFNSALYKNDRQQDRWGRLIGSDQRLRRTGKYYYLTGSGNTELVQNGAFADASSWTTTGSMTIGGGNASGASGTVEQSIANLTPRVSAYVTFTTTNHTAGSVTVSLGGAAGTARTSSGTYAEELDTIDGGDLVLTVSGSFDGEIDNVSVKWLGGYQINMVRASNPPSNLVAEYVRSAGELASNRSVDFPREYRSLIPAFAAVKATAMSWFVGMQQEIVMLNDNLTRTKQDAWRRARMSRQPKQATPYPMVGDHWIT